MKIISAKWGLGMIVNLDFEKLRDRTLFETMRVYLFVFATWSTRNESLSSPLVHPWYLLYETGVWTEAT